MSNKEPALAYSYLRFSSPQQAAGDSVRRQTAAREAWLAAHPSVRLDTSLVMTDAGRSAFRRKGWDTYALARFVECIKAGTIRPGSYLLVENLDRLSREDAGEATELFLSIVNKGIVVVQLSPVVMEFARPVNVQSLMFAIVELSRGHSESAAKSERVGAAWARKQREARERVVTHRLPGWVRERGGKLVLDPAGAATVRRLFEMARSGVGVRAISMQLNADGTPTLSTRKAFKGRAVKWCTSTVHLILTSRAVLGEYQPMRGRGAEAVPAGDSVTDYFPPLIDQDTFHAVQGALQDRARCKGGRRGKHVNLFAGMLRDARGGGSLTYRHRKDKPSVLIPVDSHNGRGGMWASYPAAVFERAILSRLVEVSPADVRGDTDGGRLVESLAGQLAEHDTLIRLWTTKMSDPNIVDVVAAKLGELNTQRRSLAEQLADARRDAASPLAESWGEFRGLAGMLDKDTSDELRLRVRAALRRAIQTVACLFLPGWGTRVAAVQVWFTSGESRSYIVVFDRRNTHVRSFPSGAGGFDLREPRQAAKLERVLSNPRILNELLTPSTS